METPFYKANAAVPLLCWLQGVPAYFKDSLTYVNAFLYLYSKGLLWALRGTKEKNTFGLAQSLFLNADMNSAASIQHNRNGGEGCKDGPLPSPGVPSSSSSSSTGCSELDEYVLRQPLVRDGATSGTYFHVPSSSSIASPSPTSAPNSHPVGPHSSRKEGEEHSSSPSLRQAVSAGEKEATPHRGMNQPSPGPRGNCLHSPHQELAITATAAAADGAAQQQRSWQSGRLRASSSAPLRDAVDRSPPGGHMEEDFSVPANGAAALFSAEEQQKKMMRFPCLIPLLVAVTALCGYVAFAGFYIHYLFYTRTTISTARQITASVLLVGTSLLASCFFISFYSLQRSDPGVVPASPWAAEPQRGYLPYGPPPMPTVPPAPRQDVSAATFGHALDSWEGGSRTSREEPQPFGAIPDVVKEDLLLESHDSDDTEHEGTGEQMEMTRSGRHRRQHRRDQDSGPHAVSHVSSFVPHADPVKPICVDCPEHDEMYHQPGSVGPRSGGRVPARPVRGVSCSTGPHPHISSPLRLCNPYTVYWREVEEEVGHVAPSAPPRTHSPTGHEGAESEGDDPTAEEHGPRRRGLKRRRRQSKDHRGRTFLTARLRYCLYCQQYMPDRAYHCLQCRQCVYLFDHHCSITNNCVGVKNYKIFLAFVIHSFLFCVVSLISMLLGIFYFRGVGRTRYPVSLSWIPASIIPAFWGFFCIALLSQCFLVELRHGITAEEFVRWYGETKKREERPARDRASNAVGAHADPTTTTTVSLPSDGVAGELELLDDGSWPSWPPRYPLYLLRHEPPEARAHRIQAFRTQVFGDDWKWYDLLLPTAPRHHPRPPGHSTRSLAVSKQEGESCHGLDDKAKSLSERAGKCVPRVEIFKGNTVYLPLGVTLYGPSSPHALLISLSLSLSPLLLLLVSFSCDGRAVLSRIHLLSSPAASLVCNIPRRRCTPLNYNVQPEGPRNAAECSQFLAGFSIPIVLVALILAIYTGAMASFVAAIQHHPHSEWRIAIAVIGMLILTLCLAAWGVTYYRVVSTAPGYVPRSIWQFPPQVLQGPSGSQRSTEDDEDSNPTTPQRSIVTNHREENEVDIKVDACGSRGIGERDQSPVRLAPVAEPNPYVVKILGPNGALRFCNYCQMYKPDHAFHCKVCQRCVFMFDHHCPWINNCVGRNNYKLFLAFLINSSIALLFVTFTLIISALVMDYDAIDFSWTTVYRVGDAVFSFILAFSLILFALQFRCLYTRGMSTVESFISQQQGRNGPNAGEGCKMCGLECDNSVCPSYPFPETVPQRLKRIRRYQTVLLGPKEDRQWWELLLPVPIRTDNADDEDPAFVRRNKRRDLRDYAAPTTTTTSNCIDLSTWYSTVITAYIGVAAVFLHIKTNSTRGLFVIYIIIKVIGTEVIVLLDGKRGKDVEIERQRRAHSNEMNGPRGVRLHRSHLFFFVVIFAGIALQRFGYAKATYSTYQMMQRAKINNNNNNNNHKTKKQNTHTYYRTYLFAHRWHVRNALTSESDFRRPLSPLLCSLNCFTLTLVSPPPRPGVDSVLCLDSFSSLPLVSCDDTLQLSPFAFLSTGLCGGAKLFDSLPTPSYVTLSAATSASCFTSGCPFISYAVSPSALSALQPRHLPQGRMGGFRLFTRTRTPSEGSRPQRLPPLPSESAAGAPASAPSRSSAGSTNGRPTSKSNSRISDGSASTGSNRLEGSESRRVDPAMSNGSTLLSGEPPLPPAPLIDGSENVNPFGGRRISDGRATEGGGKESQGCSHADAETQRKISPSKRPRTPPPLPPPPVRREGPLTKEEEELENLRFLLYNQSKRMTDFIYSTPEVDVDEVLPYTGPHIPDEEIEPIDEEDVEAVVRSKPDGPRFDGDGGRYFLHQLNRGEALRTRRVTDAATEAARRKREEEAGAEGKEFMTLLQRLMESEKRMDQRFRELRKKWGEPYSTAAAIRPEPPSVFSATTDDEVREKAAAAEDFVKNHNNRVRRQNKLNQKMQERMARRQQQQQQQAQQSLQLNNNHSTASEPSNLSMLVESDSSLSSDSEDSMNGVSGTISEQPRTGGTPGDSVSQGGASASTTPVPPPRELNPETVGPGEEGRLAMVSSSTSKLTEAARAIMGMLENRADIVLPSPSETSVTRLGDVLSSTHILKLDLQDALRDRVGPTGMISGGPYFRIVPKFNIAGVGQATMSAIKTILNELRRAHIDAPVFWVNLREEPLVYIHNNAHIVRERERPLEPIIIPNATGRGIEVVEAKLKHEVLVEAHANGGNISVYVEGKDGLVEDQWVAAHPQSVLTMAEVFENIKRSTYGPAHLRYYRWPITQNIGPQPEHFDFVLEACLEDPKAVFVFNCQTGRGRTSAMIQIANIVRFYQLCVKDVAVDGRLLRGTANGPKFKTIQKLVSLFPDGKLHERRVLTLMDLADKVYSMADHINEAFADKDSNPGVAMMRLQQYAYFLVFSYYCEQRLWNYATKDTFCDWLTAHPEIKLLIAGVREKLDDQLKEERIATVDENIDAHTLQIIRHRAGNVLSSGRILCSMQMPRETAPKDLRQLAPGVPLFTCGRMADQTRYVLLQNIKEAFPNHNKVYWLSVRAEPHVVINDIQYTLSDLNAKSWVTDVGTSMHVSLKAMEQMEDRLRRDVLLEAQENKGRILVHHINAQGEKTSTTIKVVTVKTPKSVMEEFSYRSGVNYNRVPVPFVSQILSSDLDPLLRYLAENNFNKNDIYVINDWDGSTRTSVALNIITLYRASRCTDLRSLQTPRDVIQTLKVVDTDELLEVARLSMHAHRENCTNIPDKKIEVLLASTICQMLTAGSLLRTVDAVIELGGEGKEWNVLHFLDYLKGLIGVVGKNKPQSIADALHGLSAYLVVLLVSLYLDNNGDYTLEMPFSAWVLARKEVFNIVHRLDVRGEHALRYVTSENLMKADVSRRSGDVLTANFCLKADHFPGCQKKGLRPELCGAPNFRKVHLVNVYGVAIATLVGVHNILSLLGASDEPLKTYPGQSNDKELFLGFAAPRLFDPNFKPEELQRPLRGSCVWINLREEPILYVGDRPFVFRDLAAPYVNVELTGIETTKIEHVENQLKLDVLNEADEYNGKFLVHDEAQPGELVGIWEDASEDTVKTTREVYTEVCDKGYRCTMLRLPVTDEQSPEIRDFDLLVNALLPRIAQHMDRRETLSFVFNCQMGRGRTTTGMVICCLLIGLVIPEYFTELDNYYKPLYKETDSELSQGNYSIVNQLKRVLINGRIAKHRVDLVLEACSKMQNLRTAIESFVLSVRSPDFTEEQRARAHHAGIHYLVRYFNLIVFAVYLDEEYDRMQKQMKCTFVEWMSAHPEITTIAGNAALQ
eukprot:gene9749-6837_t